MKIRIGTRKSRLAMIQTEIVKNINEKVIGTAAKEAGREKIDIEIVPIITQGDKVLDRSLTSFGGKGVFTKELEEQLLDGRIDIAVHSAKDMPMEFPEGLSIGAVLEREDPRDVLVTRSGIKAEKLAPGSIIGTSSLRRELQIKHINPQVQIKLLRGNVETRLKKLENGEYDGILLAAAGLKRLEIGERDGFFFEYMDTEHFVPAAGQGILAVEVRNGELEDIMAAIHSETAAKMLEAERTFLGFMGGGCNAPCGAYCQKKEDSLRMNVMYAADGKYPVFEAMELAEEDDESCEDKQEYADDEFYADNEAYSDDETYADDWEYEDMTLSQELAARLAQRVSVGKVVLAGAGPGDKGLLSRKAWEAVKTADVIVYDNLISPSMLNDASMDAELIYAGKRSGCHSMKQEEINQILIEQAEQGKTVLRLKGGDPYIFGRGGEEAMELAARRIPFEIIPGISSSYSVPAYSGIPVTDRNLASSFHVITGHEGIHKHSSVLDYEVLAKEEGTLIFLMGVHSLKDIAEGLISCGKDRKTPAAVIERGTTTAQRTVVSDLENIWNKVKEEGIGTPAIIVIGPVVNLRRSLSWFEKGPLFGKKVLITGTRQMVRQMEEVFKPFGGETAAISLIETEGMVTEETIRYLSDLRHYTWIVFTSSNGVTEFFRQLREMELDFRCLGNVKFAVIGKGTERTLREFGFISDFIPSSYTSEKLAEEWVPGLKKDDRVLFVKAAESSKALPEALDKAGIVWDGASVYRTAPDFRRQEEIQRLGREMDYIVFTSGSGVRAFASMTEAEDREKWKGKIVSIGPVTSKEAEKEGVHVDITAAVYTAEGVRDAILSDAVRRDTNGKIYYGSGDYV